MKTRVTRRNFLETAGAAGLLGALAACNPQQTERPIQEGSREAADDSTILVPETPQKPPWTVPDAEAYPIEPDSSEVQALWTEEEMPDGWTRVSQEDNAPALSYTKGSGAVIQVDGYAFKDLNHNGKLDFYEDWRQPDNERAASLASQLPTETLAGLMCYSDVFSVEADGSNMYDNGQQHDIATLIDMQMFSFLSFANTEQPTIMARAINVGQRHAEEGAFGIPINMANNPQSFGAPDNLAMGALFDPKLAGELSRIKSRMYRAIGTTTELGPEIELASEPRWTRVGSCYTEDPALARDITRAVIDGFQSSYDKNGKDLGWGDESIVGMMKHYPGDGPGESGRESHSDAGAYNVYPGDQFETQLIPFLDGGLHLDGKTGESASVMTSMSIAYTDDLSLGELYATPYSTYKMNILRDTCAYDGLICTDWLASWAAHGLKDKFTQEECQDMLVRNGIDQIGGDTDPSQYVDVYNRYADEFGDDAARERFEASARRVLRTFFNVHLFENPYIDSTKAQDILTDEDALSVFKEANLKSIVMLKNDEAIREGGFGDKPTVYIPMLFTPAVSGYMMQTAASWDLPVDRKTADQYFNVVTDTLRSDADMDKLTVDDVQRAAADDLASCDFALVLVSGPWGGDGFDSATGEYLPLTMQYREYTANGPNVRSESISGSLVETEMETPYGTVTQKEKENRSYYGNSVTSPYEADLDAILYAANNMPSDAKVIVCVTTSHALCVHEFEAETDAILVYFASSSSGDTDDTLFLEVASGNFEPCGLLPLQFPADMDAVEGQMEDVPRDMTCYTDAAGNTYDFGFGLNWSGVIEDERTERYCVPPLTKVENYEID